MKPNLLRALLSIYPILCFVFVLDIHAQSKDELFASLRKKYGSMNMLETHFTSIEPVSGISGILKAERTGKYNLTISDRQIICDGKNVWNYTPSRKSVTISSIKNKPSSSLDIVLFTFLYSYQPIAIKEYTIGTAQHNALELSPKSGTTTLGIKSLKVFVKKGTNVISRISASDGNQEQVWDIKRMNPDAKIPVSYFTFSIPDKTEIIDLR